MSLLYFNHKYKILLCIISFAVAQEASSVLRDRPAVWASLFLNGRRNSKRLCVLCRVLVAMSDDTHLTHVSKSIFLRYSVDGVTASCYSHGPVVGVNRCTTKLEQNSHSQHQQTHHCSRGVLGLPHRWVVHWSAGAKWFSSPKRPTSFTGRSGGWSCRGSPSPAASSYQMTASTWGPGISCTRL